MSWPPWRRTAERSVWFEEHPMWLPVCYQLALGPPRLERDEDAEVVFVGASPHEKVVFDALEGESAPYSPRLRAALDAGQVLWYRAQARPTLAEAERFAAELRAELRPAWND